MDLLKNWKLKLRYGKLKTAFRHFTVIAEGEIINSNPDFGTTAGSAAFFTIQAWAIDNDQAVDMIVTIGRDLGFSASKRIYVYSTEPQQPPTEAPHAYGLNFHQYLRED
ncbi:MULTISPECIES: hypothetical protein [Rhizobium]|uniref:Uncharacterized protein n=1 Tax=Rhizobium changzhiense TaxID=2692317 RepID=A0A7Z0UCR7_9HYPH|nr:MULTISPECIES: hypothetical protein [Rhizobium]MCV9942613.1 hypothetical protein [Rhizobium sp. BT-175]MCW0015427.1 hypothetical protein [Rhizobium sp. BT-226]NZD62520.1 hypothetical protein [Rhizobium changzhiense]